MGIQKDVLVWSAADLSAVPTVGSTFTVTGTPDLMAFKDDETSVVPGDFDPAVPSSIEPNQTLSGTLDGIDFTGNNATDDVFEFELAFQVTDGTNTFNIYQIDNDQYGGTTVAYVSEATLDPDVTYTVLAQDDGVNFANGTGYETTPVWDDLAGQVDGTSANDVIGAGYVDDDDDRVDGNDGDRDVILGEGGGDTITSGAGGDLIYGDHVDDIPAGTTEYIAQGFFRDVNFELESGSFNFTDAEVSISGLPLEIRFIDNDGVLNGDTTSSETPDDPDQLVEINGVLYNFSADYVIQMSGSDGQTYDILVLDVDRDSSGLIDVDDPTSDPGDVDYENGQILIPRGNVPPPGVTLTAFAPTYDLVTENYSALNGAAVVTNYNDSIDAGSGDDTVFGGQGADTIDGGNNNDRLEGGTGADSIDGGIGSDLLFGGDGDDYLDGGGAFGNDDTVYGGEGDDTILGGTGSSGDSLFGEAGNDQITGGGGDDTIKGGTGTDTLDGGAGNDTIDGGSGNDSIIGGDDQDRLVGKEGDDTILGGTGNDTIFGDAPDSGFDTGVSLLGSYANQVNTDTAGFQSPPLTQVLANGQVAHVWLNDGTGDNDLDMVPQIRLANPDGTWATGQIDLNSLWAVDGNDTYDWDNMDIDLLPDGNLVISYVRSSLESGADEPVFSIIDPSQLGTAGQYVLTNQEVQSNDTTTWESPPVTTVLDNGNILFVWSKNGTSDATQTMELQGRIFDPSSNTWQSGDFLVSDIAVDGTDGAEVDNLDIEQLAGGNVVVSWARSNAETGSTEPVFRILDADGNPVSGTLEIQQVDDTTFESPADIVALDDGNFMAVWIDNGYSDDSTTMVLEGRVFDASGNAVTGDFSISVDAVDGWDGYDNSSFSATVLGNGNVVVGFVENSLSGGGDNEPQFSIVASDGTVVAQDVEIAQTPDHPWAGPPVIEAIGDSGHFVAVFADGNQASGGATGLNFRIYDGDGNPVTNEIELTNATDGSAMSGTNVFDWDHIDVDYNDFNNTFTISWVGQSDGSNSGVYTSGPIAGAPQSAGNGNDTLDGGTGNDTLDGGEGSDTFLLNDGYGTDSITGGEDAGDTDVDLINASGITNDGVDVFLSGNEAGNITSTEGTANFVEIEAFVLTDQADTFDGGNNNSGVSVDGGAGNDSLEGGSGDDTLIGGDGDDVLIAGNNTGAGDFLSGGAGNDTLVDSFWNATMDGGDDADLFQLGTGDASVIGGDGGNNFDTMSFILGNDADDAVTITFTTGGPEDGVFSDLDGDDGTFTGIEAFELTNFNDTFDATNTSQDVDVSGGAGDDSITGGTGNDRIEGGTGADTLTGGAGADEFVVDAGGDIITDFDTGTGIGNGDPTDNDFVDLTQFYNATTLAAWNAANPGNQYPTPLGWLRADQADGTLDQAGGLQVQNALSAVAASALNAENTGVVCFTKGTVIATARGEVPVERLEPGDLVQTMDHGLQPIRWIGARHLSKTDLIDKPNLLPIRITPAVMGLPQDERDLVVSPQHRILVSSKIAQKMLGDGEVLIAANKLLGLEGVEVARDISGVTYYHVLCDEHEILFANNIPAESLYLGPQALKSLSPEGLAEIRALFPELVAGDVKPRPCRKIISGSRAKNLCRRHAKNQKPIRANGEYMQANIQPYASILTAAAAP